MRILKNTLFCVFVALLAVFISSCSEVICTTPYIVADDGCCLDEDGDGECGADKIEAKESVYSGEDIVYLVNESVENLGGEKVELEENLTVESEDTFGYFLGCSDCAINFVIYGDYQDSVTKKFNNEILPLLLEEYEELIRFEFKNFPKDYHRLGRKAGESVYCAGDQEYFWEYHNRLFSEDFFTDSDFNNFVAEMGLDVVEFDACLKNRKYDSKITEDIDDAEKNKVNDVPTYVINGEKFSGYRSFKFLKNILDEELKFSLKHEIIKKIIASVQGDGYFILPGTAAMDVKIKDSYFSNDLKSLTGKLYLSAEDKDEKDSAFSEDNARLSLEFEEKSSGTVDKHILGIDKLIKVAGVDENHHGGVASDLFVFGNTGRGTELLPKTYAYVYVWAEGSLYVGDDLLYDDLVLEFYVIQGVREDGIVTSLQEDDLEIYVFIERDYGDMQEFEGGKLYLFWDDGINFKSV